MKTLIIIRYIIAGIAGAMGVYFGGWFGLLAVILGQISMIIAFSQS